MLEEASFLRLLTAAIAVSVEAEICLTGLLLEFTLIQISLVNGCLIMTPANSVFLSLRSSC